MAQETHDAGAFIQNYTHPLRTGPAASFSVSLCSEDALAVRPFVTDDARIVYKGQLGTETYGGTTVVKGEALHMRCAHWKA